MLRMLVPALLGALLLAQPALAGDGGPNSTHKTGPGVVKLRGAVAAVGVDGLSVRGERGTLRCRVPARLAERFAGLELKVGARVVVVCVGRQERFRLVRLVRLRPQTGDDVSSSDSKGADSRSGPGTSDAKTPSAESAKQLVDIAGEIVSVPSTSIAVANAERGRRLVCTVPDRLAGKVAELHARDRVKMLCAVRGEAAELVAVARLEAESVAPAKPVPAPGSIVERMAAGPIAAFGEGKIMIRGDGEPVVCRVPERVAAEIGSAFAVGQQVRIGCRGLAGTTLELVKIERLG